jgi:hypothetical protein
MSFFKAHLGTLTARKQPFQQFENAVLADGGTLDKALLLSEWVGQPAAVKEKATIALVSGAYKSGKIYGFTPQSGNVVPFTFSRAGTATYFDKNGVMQTAAAGMPRIDYDPVTKECKGYLIEEGVTNLKTYSSDPSKHYIQGTIVNSADTLTINGVQLTKVAEDNSANTAHVLLSLVGGIPAANDDYTISFYIKPAGRDICRLQIGNTVSSSVALVFYNATTNTFYNPSIAGPNPPINFRYKSDVLTNGMVRLSLTITWNAAQNTLGGGIAMCTSGTITTYTGDGVSGVYYGGVQVEKGGSASSYIPTTTAQVTRPTELISAYSVPWYNNLTSEGTMYCDYIQPTTVYDRANGVVRAVTASADGFRIRSGNNACGAQNTINGVTKSLFTTYPIDGKRVKLSFAMKDLDFGITRDGLTPVTLQDSSVVRGVTGMIFGESFYSTIRAFAYFPKRLSNSELQILTT